MFATMLLLSAIQAPEVIDSPEFTPTPIQLQMHEEAIRRRGGREQELDAECCQIAQRWAEHMAATNSMYHGGGEQIIAMGYRSVASCFNGWMNSSGHRYWVLSSTRYCGWGAAQSANGTWYYAGCFRGSRGTITRETEVIRNTPSGTSYRYTYRRRPLLFWRRR